MVVHLAAKAGVRPSVTNPQEYVDVNINGTQSVLDACVQAGLPKVVFGSSSSVYGLNDQVPFSEDHPTLRPASPYGATKAAGEALCHSYSNCYGLNIVSLRFFTVYGPRQCPDLAIHKFARKILDGEPIALFGDGTTSRDYTYVDDIVAGIKAAVAYPVQGYEVFNLGNDQPVQLLTLVEKLEKVLGKKAVIDWQPMQTGDVPKTWANIDKSRSKLGYVPQVSLEEGLQRFVDWLYGMRSKAR